MNNTSATFSRPLSANEHLYLANKRYFSHFVIQLTVDGLGAIAKPALEQALQQTSVALPGTRLRQSGKSWIADGKPPPVIELDDDPDTGSLKPDSAQTTSRFNASAGYTCDVLLARGALRNRLVFRALHAVMDGQGLMLWAKAVFQTLRAEAVPPVISIMNEDLWLDSQQAPCVKAPSKLPQHTGPAFRGNLVETRQFHVANCTVKNAHPAVIAKLSLGVQAVLMHDADSTGCVMVPVDLRPELPAEQQRATANLSLPLYLPLQRGASWQMRASALLEELHAKKHIVYRDHYRWHRRLPHALLAWSVKKLWDKQTREGKYFVSSVISHLGRVALEEFSTDTFTATAVAAIPCIAPLAPFSLAITENSIGDDEVHTHISLTASKALHAEPDKLLRELVNAAGFSCAENAMNPPPAPHTRFENAPAGLHQLFEQQAKRSPQQPCLIFGDDVLDYDSVNRAANQLAHDLMQQGLKPGQFVGVGLPRSPELIVSILAIMKAGGVYLPLDPDLPMSRLQYFIDDSKVQWVLTTGAHRNLFASVENCIALDETANARHAQPTHNLDLPVAPHAICYLLYTSGSTGFPKGALNTHEGAVNHFCWMQKACAFSINDATLQKTPISFDASLLEIILPLQCGASIVIVAPGYQNDAAHMLGLIRRHQVSFLSIVPSILDRFLDQVDTAPTPSLRTFLVGGETFSALLYEKILRHFPASRIYNLYGPAEAAIDSVVFDCSNAFDGSTVPIGKPIANMQAWIVDHALNPVANGETGELLIAGIGVGAGYWQRPELNAERFIAHPGAPRGGNKAYRTGDLARQLPCGNLQFVGRRDQQVKIRGVRIEPGEIEHQLNQIAWIKQAAVVAHKLHDQDVLIAYLSAAANANDEQKKSLRALLESTLPQYMIPTSLLFLDSLPLNSSGKIDRHALQQTLPSLADGSVRPWSAREKQIANLWQNVLGRTITPGCNFFLLGGNSMAAVDLLTKIESALGVKLKPQVLFEHADFEDFASAVMAMTAENPSPQCEPVV